MNKEFLQLMMEKTAFPPEAKQELLQNGDRLTASGQEPALDSAVRFFYEHQLDIKLVTPQIEEIAQKAGLSPYTIWLFFLVEAALSVREAFQKKDPSEKLFWDTFSDLRYKVNECKNMHNVWGNFVAFWYPIFYSCDIVKLGRLEYENAVFEEEKPFTWGGLTVNPGDPVKGVHIPSSGEPFDEAARLDSYGRAYEFFKNELKGGPLVCVCHSWLLYPPYKALLSPTSNIRGFMGDFHILGWEEEPAGTFHDNWRLFGPDCEKPTAQLPENTSMQRAFKKYFLEGGRAGEGRGILLFQDGKILNR